MLASIARIKNAQKQAQEKTQEKCEEPKKIDYKRINAHVVKKKGVSEEQKKQNLSIKDMIAKAKEASIAKSTPNRKMGIIPIGTRVFHGNFGIGNIIEAND